MSLFPSGLQIVTSRTSSRSVRPYTLDLRIGWSALRTLEGSWNRMIESHPEPLPCSSWEAAQALEAHVPSKGVPVVVRAQVDGATEVLLPLELIRWPGGAHARFLGGGWLERHEPLVTPRGATIAADGLLRRLARRLGRAVVFDLDALPPRGLGAEWLCRGLVGSAGWHRVRGRREGRVSLAGGWDRVRVSVPGSLRRRARLAFERASRVGFIELHYDEEPHREDLDAIFDFARRSRLDPLRAALVASVAEEAARRGRLRIALLRFQEKTAAATLYWHAGQQAVELCSVHDPECERLELASVLRLDLLRHLAEEGRARSLLLSRDGAAASLSLDCQHQERLIGAPLPGFGRIAAQLGAWYKTQEAIGSPLAQTVERVLSAMRREAPPMPPLELDGARATVVETAPRPSVEHSVQG